ARKLRSGAEISRVCERTETRRCNHTRGFGGRVRSRGRVESGEGAFPRGVFLGPAARAARDDGIRNDVASHSFGPRHGPRGEIFTRVDSRIRSRVRRLFREKRNTIDRIWQVAAECVQFRTGTYGGSRTERTYVTTTTG